MRKDEPIREWHPLDVWDILPDEAYALLYAFEHLWNQAELMRYFGDFQVWSVALKGAIRIAPLPEDMAFFETLTRIALGKLADLPPDAILEDGQNAEDHRKALRNFRARNLGIED